MTTQCTLQPNSTPRDAQRPRRDALGWAVLWTAGLATTVAANPIPVFDFCSSGGSATYDGEDLLHKYRRDEGSSSGGGGLGGGFGQGIVGGCGGGTRFPLSMSPVDLAGGQKYESAVDLIVQVTGVDFRVERSYLSDTSEVDGLAHTVRVFPPLTDVVPPMGMKWFISPFASLELVLEPNETDKATISLLNSARLFTTYRSESATDIETRFLGGGDATEWFEYDIVGVHNPENGEFEPYPTLALREPGRLDRHFHRPIVQLPLGGTGDLEIPPEFPQVELTPIDPLFYGRLAAEVDPHGNRREYDWEAIDTLDCEEPPERVEMLSLVRLKTVRFINAEGELEAVVAFDWELLGDLEVDNEVQRASHPLYGMLRRIRVLRPDDVCEDLSSPAFNEEHDCGFYETHRVEYSYFDDVHAPTQNEADPKDECETDPVEFAHWSPAPATELGASGDMVQVIRYTRVDWADVPEHGELEELGEIDEDYVARVEVWQYRYYADETVETVDYRRCNELGAFHSAALASGPLYNVDHGAARQLKLVINPEQVEYYAWSRNNEGETPTRLTLVERAWELLELNYDDTFDSPDEVEHRVIDLAAKVIVYEPGGENKVRRQYLSASGCGCGGGAGSQLSVMEEFEYWGQSPFVDGGGWNTPNTYTHTTVTREYLRGAGTYTGLHRELRVDMRAFGNWATPYTINEVVIAPAPDSREWVTHYVYDDGNRRLLRVMSPSATADYTPATSTTVPGYVPSVDTGFVRAFAYDAFNRVTKVMVRGDGCGGTLPGSDTEKNFFEGAADSAYSIVQKIEYNGTRRDLPNRITRYPDEDDNHDTPSRAEITEFKYGFRTNGTLASVETWVKSAKMEENGPDASAWHKSAKIYWPNGDLGYDIAADGAITSFGWHPIHNQPTTIIRNITLSGVTLDNPPYNLTVSTTGRVADGGTLTTTHTYDALGRLSSTTSPGGVTTRIARAMLDLDSRPGLSHYAEITLPHEDDDEFFGPARIVWRSAGGATLGRSDYALGEGGFTLSEPGAGYVPLVESVDLDVLLTKQRVTATIAGVAEATMVWHDIAGNGFYLTTMEHDDKGRVKSTTNPNGTITAYAYDVLDRTTKVSVGVDAQDMHLVEEMFYDNDEPAQGMGDGNLTLVRSHVTGSETRITEHFYDGRNRRVRTKGPLPPYDFVVYDNLDRPVERALFSSAPTAIDDPNRGLYEVTRYDLRGMVYSVARAIDPTDETPDFLETHFWRDGVGRVIAQWSPGSPGAKTVYDAHGRVKVAYATDRGGDAAPGAEGNLADAKSVADDIVLEQTNHEYNAAGLLRMTAVRRRSHDATETGDLAEVEDDEGVVTMWTATLYDAGRRPVERIDFGTNDTTDGLFRFITTAPDPDDPDADALIATTAYNTRGLVGSVTDPEGTVTAFFYDDMNRRVGVVENWTNSVVERDDVNAFGWKLSAGSSDADKDRATITVYDGAGNTVFLVAAHNGGAGLQYQVTTYVYGVEAEAEPEPFENLIDSNDLLAMVIYPDGDDDEDNVTFNYNLQGELVQMTDQAGTVHQYTRDAAGRVTLDHASTLHEDIDGRVRKIAYTYDGFGRRESVRSRDGSNNVLDAVAFAYTGLWQVESVAQNPVGDVNLTTPVAGQLSVDYVYDDVAFDDEATGPHNYSRLASIAYPSNPGSGRTVLEMLYGASEGLDDALSRVVGQRWERASSPDPIGRGVEYDYVGLGLPVHKRLMDDETVVATLDRQTDPTNVSDPVLPGVYTALDRFGRVARQQWLRGDWEVDVTPELVNLHYPYDRSSNVLARYDRRAEDRSVVPDRDEVYSYDGLDRLVEAERGKYNHSTPALASGKRSQKWSLDPLGNWKTNDIDLDGNGSYGTDDDFIDARAHNNANEIAGAPARELYDPRVGMDEDPAEELELHYDAAGNLVKQQRLVPDGGGWDVVEWRYVYDAWNRLVEVKIDPDAHAEPPTDPEDIQIRARYGYNGLHWRVWRIADEDLDVDALPDAANLYYYDAMWRLLEERVRGDFGGGATWANADPAPGGSGDLMKITQRFWCLHYIDDLLAWQTQDEEPDGAFQDGDALFYALTDRLYSVIGVMDGIDADYTLIERVRYTAYGAARHVPFSLGDANADGVVNFADFSIVLARYGKEYEHTDPATGYTPDGDFGLDGAIDFDDYTLVLGFAGQGLPEGALSLPEVGNTIGYTGHHFDPATGMTLARFRWLEHDLGRWLTRDPAGYDDGGNLYQYTGSSAPSYVDPSGLKRIIMVIHGQDFFGLRKKDTWSLLRDLVDKLNSDPDNHVIEEDKDADLFFRGARKLDRCVTTTRNKPDPNSKDEEASEECTRDTLVLIGHSNGADAARKIAFQLKNRKRTVDLLFLFDPIGKPVHNHKKPHPVSDNVKDAINVYQTQDKFWYNLGPFGMFRLHGYTISPGINDHWSHPKPDSKRAQTPWAVHVDIVEHNQQKAIDAIRNVPTSAPCDEK